jgi:hypothetical protein
VRGKRAKELRESAFIAASGFTPARHKYMINEKTGQIIVNPNHVRAVYKHLKTEGKFAQRRDV